MCDTFEFRPSALYPFLSSASESKNSRTSSSPFDRLSLFTSYHRISDFQQPLSFASCPSYPIMNETLAILYVIWPAIPAPLPTSSAIHHLRRIVFPGSSHFYNLPFQLPIDHSTSARSCDRSAIRVQHSFLDALTAMR